jgi:hypothetical protein
MGKDRRNLVATGGHMSLIISLSLAGGTAPFLERNVGQLLDEMCRLSGAAADSPPAQDPEAEVLVLSYVRLARHFLRESPNRALRAKLDVCAPCVLGRAERWVGCRQTGLPPCPKGKN